MADTTHPRGKGFWQHWRFLLALAIAGLVTFVLVALLINISTRKQEERVPFTRVAEVTEISTDPVPWGMNWPRQFDGYRRTVDATQTRYGGSSAIPQQKLDAEPWLKRLYAGYAFSIDYRERRGHAYMLYDQEVTEHVTKKPQPGACLHCHGSMAPTWRRVGAAELGQPTTDEALAKSFDWPAVMKGFEKMSTIPYAQAHAELLKTPDGTPGENTPLMPGGSSTETATPANVPDAPPAPNGGAQAQAHGEGHPVSCIDCHDPKTMGIRVTRPGFINGIRALANSDAEVPFAPSIARWREGNRQNPYDPNVDASRQELRSFVCGQCHVEYYCGPKMTLTFPWSEGLKVEQIESTWSKTTFPSGEPFNDWVHGETGAPVFKAQHPEFEMWSQGVHARAGVACADCHMPYVREGAMKVSDHWVRSPLLMVNRSCQTCHNVSEKELQARVATIQDRTKHLLDRSAVALTDMLDAILAAKAAGASEEQLGELYKLQRAAQWRIDFVSSENSMGFHADQESARVLAEALDYARQAQARAIALTGPGMPHPQVPEAPVQGVTPTERAPAGPYKTQAAGATDAGTAR
jgi:nitrite reductase (cytochrome c-552)